MTDARGAEFWDERYADDAYAFGERPNAFLAAQVARIRPAGRVLVPADGEGRNGVWLAERGFDVVTVDLSPRGVEKARALARRRGVRLEQACADLTRWTWPEAVFDAVVAIFFLLPPPERARVHGRMVAALRPGGLLILESYHKDQLRRGLTSGGPKRLDMLLDRPTLLDEVAGLETLLLDEADPILDEGPRHQGPAATLRYVGRKPA